MAWRYACGHDVVGRAGSEVMMTNLIGTPLASTGEVVEGC